MEERLLMSIQEKMQTLMGWDVNWKNNLSQMDTGKDGEMLLIKNGEKHIFPFAVKKEYRKHHLLELMATKNQYGQLAAIAETIPASLKEQLRANHIGYIDGAGNVYLEHKGLFILVQGQKKKIQKDKYRHRAFTKSGLKVVFQLLIDKELVNAPYRTIAKQASVSNDTVSKTISSLQNLGFIIHVNQERMKLTNQKQLLERWIYHYGDKLKPSLFLGQFRFLDKQQGWQKINLQSTSSQWGGEPAAELLTNYLRAELLTLYTEERMAILMKEYRIVPDERGSIRIYKKFCKTETSDNKTVHPLLVYADLVYSGDARNLETAKRLYEEQLQHLF